ncbi:MAG: hemerythrin family protein [Lachnospiraceae bacterium]|nr:hemerythrin family protein [Lachnospiraceae bacterium]
MGYELTKELETGNVIIDNEHRELFKAVNNIIDACSKGKGRDITAPAIKFLLEYVDKHFSHEEQLQRDNKYPDMAAHKAFHESYKKQLKEIASQIPANNPTIADLAKLNGHLAVLINHIRIEDKKLGNFLKQK